MADKGVFTDSEESESGQDFSASEDEWMPQKDDVDLSEEDEEETAESDDSDSDDEGTSRKAKGKSNKIKTKTMKKITKTPKLQSGRSQQSSLRSKLFRRYNPPPKTVSKSPVPVKIANILSNSQYVQKTKMLPKTTTAASSDSESSSDEGFIRPDDIDINSKIFDAETKEAQNVNKEPIFDCNAGMQLSDSSDEANDSDEDDVQPTTSNAIDLPKGKQSIIEKINAKSSNEVHDFSNLQQFAKNLESAKAQLEKLKDKEINAKKATDESDVTKLLSLGEQNAVASTSVGRKRKHKDDRQSDDSDWENVSDDNEHGTAGIQDIQITVGSSTVRDMSRDKKRIIDVEACLKRRLNRDIKEKQVLLHKTSVLCWIAHGNYINRILNNMTLMELCLKLLPSKNAYPKGDTDIKYYSMITDWFHNLFELKSKHLYSGLKGIPSKTLSLALQIRSKKVISKCDYVLLFVSMLRSIGIQCRLIINFAVPPIRPPQKDLFVISTKPKDADGTEANESSKTGTKTSLAKKVKASAKKMKTSFVEKESEKTKKKNENSKESKAKQEKSTKSVKLAATNSTKSAPEKNKILVSPSKNITRNFKIELARTTKSMANKLIDAGSKRSSSPSKSPDKQPNRTSKLTNKGKPDDHSYNKKSPVPGPSTKPLSDKNVKSKTVDKKSSAPSTKPPLDKAETSSSVETSAKSRPISSSTSCIEQNGIKPKTTKLAKETGSTVAPFSPRKTRQQAAKSKINLKLPQLDGGHDVVKKGTKRANIKSKKTDSEESNSDSDFAPSPPKRIRSKVQSNKSGNQRKSNVANTSKNIDRRVFSSEEDVDQEEVNTDRMDFWVEAYAEKEKKWIVIDPVKRKVDCVDYIRKLASKPIIYTFGWNNDNSIRDVTPRYCSQFHTNTRKLRAEQLWIDDALRLYIERRNVRTIVEDVEFSKLHMDTPMPKSINEFKNHPLYALERHLLKFEAIYPPNPLTLGYIRNEPIYARECVHQLHSREIWVKQARTVKVGETPYKIVKARPKWNRALNQMEEAKPLEIFGHWQTQPYEPPVAENGMVPRNPYGNVELFKPEMLPIGTRHLQLPNLNRVCKKMGVDCAQAVIGFDFHGGSSHPTFDGFVVCEEFADAVIEQWEIEQEEQIRKETDKREARVFGNWKKLIKGLLIRERLKRKFNFGADDKTEKSHGKKKTQK